MKQITEAAIGGDSLTQSFPVNFVKLLRTPFLTPLGDCFQNNTMLGNSIEKK